jgi:hypothetical protein
LRSHGAVQGQAGALKMRFEEHGYESSANKEVVSMIRTRILERGARNGERGTMGVLHSRFRVQMNVWVDFACKGSDFMIDKESRVL